MKRTSVIILLFLSLFGSARTSTDIKALFIYQFTRMIDWPQCSKTGMFRIGVIGSFQSYKDISDIAMGRNVGHQNIEVMNVMAINQLNLTDFHILVVGDAFCTPEKLHQINKVLENKPTLIISNKINYSGEDVCIGFEGNGEDFKYYYIRDLIDKKGLKCSQDFLLLGKKTE